jgi:hypothetical protein
MRLSKKVQVTCDLFHAEWNYKIDRINYTLRERKKNLQIEWKHVGKKLLKEYEFDGVLLSKDINIFIDNEIGYRPIFEVNVSKDVVNYHLNYGQYLDIEGMNRRTTALEEMLVEEYPTINKFDELEIYNPKTKNLIVDTIINELEENTTVPPPDSEDVISKESTSLYMYTPDNTLPIPNWLLPVIALVSVICTIGGIIIGSFLGGGLSV